LKNPKVAFISLLAVVCLTTLFIRIPLPSRGYFNFGDVAVVFAGLVLGGIISKKRIIWGFGVGGLGSALADILGGFAIFSPLTLIAKGLEGAMAAFSSQRTAMMNYFFLLIGGALMVATYFIGEVLMPNIGYQGAVSEVIPNIIQAIGGIVGGRLTYAAYEHMVGDSNV